MYCPNCGKLLDQEHEYGFGYGSIIPKWSIQQIYCSSCEKRHSVADDWKQYEQKIIIEEIKE